MRIVATMSVVYFVLAGPLSAQSIEGGKAGTREVLPRALEVELARSAAPPAVSGEATVLLWNGEGFMVGEAGTNGVTCYVGRSWPESVEPQCFDDEGARTILPIHLRQIELWHQGKSKGDIDAAIAEGILTGEFKVPSRPVMSYMMSARQELISDEGQAAGAWRSHLMIYFPYLTQEALGLAGGAPSLDAAMVGDPGTPLSNIVIVLENFAATQTEGVGGR